MSDNTTDITTHHYSGTWGDIRRVAGLWTFDDQMFTDTFGTVRVTAATLAGACEKVATLHEEGKACWKR